MELNHKGLKCVSKVTYFLFPEEFNFNFYNAFCQNLGGRIPGSDSQEGFHEVMDQLENIVVPEIHEKCLHASGALMVWVGVTDAYNVNIRQTLGVIVGRSNICQEGVWVDSTTLDALAWEGLWMSGQPNGGTYANCARTHLDRYHEETRSEQSNQLSGSGMTRRAREDSAALVPSPRG